jgi:ATP-dependent Zn protease
MIGLALSKKREQLELFAQALLQKETLTGDELQELSGRKIEIGEEGQA